VTPYSLRAAVDADLTLTYAITRDAMLVYVERTWGVWDEAEQLDKHRRNFTPATHRIVVVGGQDVGLLAAEDEPHELWLVKLYLLEDARGRGLGSALVRRVIDEADRAGKGVRLRVLRSNPRAKALYERLGFRVVGEEPERFFMARPHAATGPAGGAR
jgi:ribosomal protein S18 acetylase RimI-like enzyme